MPKKRRKLNKLFEKQIYSSKKQVELTLAKIYDINDEDIQKDYMNSFGNIVYLFDQLKSHYDLSGFNDESEVLLNNYQTAFIKFGEEFEI